MTRARLPLPALFALLCLTASAAEAQVTFRMPLSMEHCGDTCSVSAHYDSNRAAGLLDYGCGAWTYSQHDGTDYAVGSFAGMDAGRPVLAAAPGVVIAAHDGEFDRCTTANCGTANYVMIRHSDGKVTWYWHLKKWSVQVQVGQSVACGQQLGEAGSSGLSTGPHLHFGTQYSEGGAIDDPYASASGCGGDVSWWESQGAYGGLPAPVCQGGNTFCVGKASGYWCNGDKLTVCSAGAVSSETDCPHGCQGMPPGTPDQCAAAPAPTTGTVKGVVWDLGVTDDAAASLGLGARLPGALITCSCGESATARPDDGFWSMELAPGSYTLTVTHDGYLANTRDVVVTAGAEQWASMGLAREPPPGEPPPSEPDDDPENPTEDDLADGGRADDDDSDSGVAPDGEDADGYVLVPQQPMGQDARGSTSSDDSDDLPSEAVGCRCVASPLNGGGATAALGMLLMAGALVRRRHRPARVAE